ncbi:MAG TPA: LrgB family protein [Burkholderiales bacterium]|jgi:predicted murein hydrolase (TIGR00659 family)|nr:LrgB family protein [Burkholderiales bacterium]
MSGSVREIWVYLAATPLLGLTLTLVAYLLGDWIYRRARQHPLLHPVLLAIAALVALLTVTGTPYQTYFEGAQFVHFLLGPATVALAVPLYFNFSKLRRLWLPLLGGLIAGSLTAALSAIGVAWSFGASAQTLISLAPKSVTAPVAMGIAEKLGGLPSLTAILVVSTGILGAVLGPWTLNRLRVRDEAIRGFAIGVASHGIGTARAFQESEQAGAFSGLAMGLNILATSLILPLLVRLLGLG